MSIVGQTKILNKDNVYKGNTWGEKGDKVLVISVNGNAVIYENDRGKRFPCNIKDLR